MDCKVCGEFFQPTPEEERLIATKQMEEVCLSCAMKQADAANAKDTDWKPEPLRVQPGRYDGTKLFRVEKIDKDGKLICFIAMPPKPLVPRHKSLRKPRKGVLHVGIISGGGDQQRATSQPRVVVHTNVDTFARTNSALWVSKVPGFWDAQTGVARIEIAKADIVSVEEHAGEKRVILKDGSVLRMRYE